MSRVGKKSISLPDKVKVTVGEDSQVTVEGPKGKLSWSLPSTIGVEQEDGALTVTRRSEERTVRAMHGTARALIAKVGDAVCLLTGTLIAQWLFWQTITQGGL